MKPMSVSETAAGIGEDLLRWAGLVDDDGQPAGTLDEIEQFGEIIQSSSIPEACQQIRKGMLDAEAIR